MTRARIIHKLRAPSYSDFYAQSVARHGPVIRGAHLDVDYDKPETLRDPFKMARRFAFALANDTGEPFAWGWFDDPGQGFRPAVCAADVAHEHMRVNGRTDALKGIDVTGRHTAG